MTDTEKNLQQRSFSGKPHEPGGSFERGKYAIAISMGVPGGILPGTSIFDNAALGGAMSVILTPAIYFMLVTWKS